LPAGVVKLRRGLTARVFDECDGMGELYGWFTQFLQALQEKALLQVDKTDPTREVSGRKGLYGQVLVLDFAMICPT
jgi:hypothetical protein